MMYIRAIQKVRVKNGCGLVSLLTFRNGLDTAKALWKEKGERGGVACERGLRWLRKVLKHPCLPLINHTLIHNDEDTHKHIHISTQTHTGAKERGKRAGSSLWIYGRECGDTWGWGRGGTLGAYRDIYAALRKPESRSYLRLSAPTCT